MFGTRVNPGLVLRDIGNDQRLARRAHPLQSAHLGNVQRRRGERIGRAEPCIAASAKNARNISRFDDHHIAGVAGNHLIHLLENTINDLIIIERATERGDSLVQRICHLTLAFLGACELLVLLDLPRVLNRDSRLNRERSQNLRVVRVEGSSAFFIFRFQDADFAILEFEWNGEERTRVIANQIADTREIAWIVARIVHDDRLLGRVRRASNRGVNRHGDIEETIFIQLDGGKAQGVGRMFVTQ